MSLDKQTKVRRDKITQEMTYSIIGLPLADISLDCIAPATMHVILGLAKKIHEWLLKLFMRLEALEEEKSKDKTTHQFRQAIIEATGQTDRYREFLMRSFQDVIGTIDGKKTGTAHVMKEIEKITNKVATAKIGNQQAMFMRTLAVLKSELERKKTSPEEMTF